MNNPVSGDQLFVRKLTDLVLANLTREDFDMEQLVKATGMSRSSLHRKLKAIRNQNATQFIREIRLRKAMEMLQQETATASEIAYMVGFSSPAYFTKCFHEYFGYSPGEARKRVVDEGGEKVVQKRVRTLWLVVPIAILLIIFLLIVFIKDVFPVRGREKSIVVLPFKNLSNDPGNQYFADGIMEDILNNLYYISDLRVVSRTTAEHFRSSTLGSGDIARELNVRNVLEGSIRRDGDKIRVSVQLIDAGSDQHLWSQNYDRDMTDLLAVQGEIALKIADRLNAVISDTEAAMLRDIRTHNPAAYENYLKARFLQNKANSDQRYDISSEGLMSSLQYYEKAIAADTNFAEAYAGLANAWFNLSAWGWYKPYVDGIQKAKHYCSLALEKDFSCAEAHAVKGAYLMYPDHQFEEAERELKLAIQLDPNYSTARQWYAQLLMITGPIAKAREQVNRALELEPYFWVVQNLNSWIYYFEKKYDKGLEACTYARDLNPNSSDNIWLFVLLYARLGEAEKAATELQKLLGFIPNSEEYAHKLTEACDTGGVNGIFRWLVEVNKNKPLPVEGLNGQTFYISWWYAIAGDRQQSIAWLERTLNEKLIPFHYFNLLGNHPDFDLIRGDPRFIEVMKKAGLSAYNNRSAR
jgi:TolB-like protein/AraC-like DNA-binding protein/Tfp pilus assembly protein PilF